jgi:hypothetical protein
MQPRSSGAAIALVAGLAVTLTACGGADPRSGRGADR